jgi:hypothetical protein
MDMWATRRVVQALWSTQSGYPQGGISITLPVRLNQGRRNQVVDFTAGRKRDKQGKRIPDLKTGKNS